jgi:tetratricopeptide (TPR) repeat protein
MKKRIPRQASFFFLCFFYFLGGLMLNQGHAHAKNLDSLLAQLPLQKDDTNKVLLLEEIVYLYSFKDRSKQLQFLEAQLKLSEKINYPKGIADAYVSYADYNLINNELDDVEAYVTKAQDIYTQINYQMGLVHIYSLMGSYYKIKGEYENALLSLQKAFSGYEALGSDMGQAVTTGSMALLFINMDRYEDAELYFLKSLGIRKKIGDKRGMAMVLTNLGSSNLDNEKYDKALGYFKACLELERELNDLSIITVCSTNIANIYIEKGHFIEAQKILKACNTNYGELGDTVMMGYVKLYEAVIHRKTGEADKGIMELNEAMKIIQPYQLDHISLSEFYMEYYNCYKDIHQYQNALENYEIAVKYQTDLYSTETTNKVSELKEKYETEKKEQENLVLKANNQVKDLQLDQQKYLIYGMIAMLLFILVIAVLLVRFTRIQHQHKNMALEQKLLRSRMNPHFIFNALLAIQSFMFENEPREAGKFLSAFARLMRAILENASGERVLLSKEIKWLEDYIQLQQLRFDGSFEYTIQIDPNLSTESLFVPPMLFQPFIENAIEHGLSKREQGGLLTVNFSWVKEFIQVEIQDNGTGFSITQKGEGKHVSLATAITQERLFLINRRKRKKIHFSISSVQGAGTKVLFNIPAINDF